MDRKRLPKSFSGIVWKTTLLYLVVAGLWILFSDTFLLWLDLDAQLFAAVSALKGLAFVGVTAALLYLVLLKQMRKVGDAYGELARTEIRSRHLVESLPHGVLELDAHGVIQYCNAATAGMLGEHASRLAGMPVVELASDEGSREALEAALLSGKGGGTAGSCLFRPRRPDGTLVHVQLDWTRDLDSSTPGYLAVLTDISDMQLAQASSKRLAAIVEATSDLVCVSDPAGRILEMNGAGRALLGLHNADLSRVSIQQLMPVWAYSRMMKEGVPRAAVEGTWSGETAVLRPDGVDVPVSQVIISHKDQRGTVRYYSTIMRDITERQRADDALRTSREQYRCLVENANEGLAVAQGGKVCYVNPKLIGLLGFRQSDYIDRPWLDFVHPEDREAVLDWYRRQARGEDVASPYSFRFLTWKGGSRWVEATAVPIIWEGESATLSFFMDVTDQVEAQFRLNYLAEYDEMTGLPNRRLFLGRLAQAMAYAGRKREMLAVMYLDLNRFRIFNESHGHEMGDRLIQTIAEALARVIGSQDTVARVASDEFALLIQELEDDEQLRRKIRQVLEAVSAPVHIGDHEFFISASAGISVFPADGSDPGLLLRNAANALDGARRSGAGTFQFYSESLNRSALDRLRLETDLRHALSREEFQLYYQPQADVLSGRIVGAEALLRWQRGDRGLVQPADFIPVLEETNLILDVGEWVLETACRQQRRWLEELGQDLRVSVNISARQLSDPGFPEKVGRILAGSGVSPEAIELEITESSLVQDPEKAVDILHRLKELGITIGIDDFGTGYSSLSYFRRFPVDTLKIDKSFVAELVHDVDTSEISRAIIAMGHSLRTHVVAEGVETVGQLAVLRRHECDWMQGYLLSPPVPAAEFHALLEQGVALPAPEGPEAPRYLLLLARPGGTEPQLADAAAAAGLSVRQVADPQQAYEFLAAHRVALLAVRPWNDGPVVADVLNIVRELYPWAFCSVLAPAVELQQLADVQGTKCRHYRGMAVPLDDAAAAALVDEALQRFVEGRPSQSRVRAARR
ncbi:MAG: EAL domain-containing protein [Ectothiorhodospiraceae bacterium]|nr:EAL domain-containing protein [Ectothiorhodospiraceae bacterium]MCH8505594.1 EAL domain-containing protein [Ectothiorhodospiraceae bacterium]